jgi:hypothetical protein
MRFENGAAKRKNNSTKGDRQIADVCLFIEIHMSSRDNRIFPSQIPRTRASEISVDSDYRRLLEYFPVSYIFQRFSAAVS